MSSVSLITVLLELFRNQTMQSNHMELDCLLPFTYQYHPHLLVYTLHQIQLFSYFLQLIVTPTNYRNVLCFQGLSREHTTSIHETGKFIVIKHIFFVANQFTLMFFTNREYMMKISSFSIWFDFYALTSLCAIFCITSTEYFFQC